MLSRDKVPAVWHDFRVSLLATEKWPNKYQAYDLPTNEVTYTQLKQLRVEFARDTPPQRDNPAFLGEEEAVWYVRHVYW